MWNGTLVMMSFAGLGEAIGDGEASGVGASAGVGAVLGVALAAAEELASGDAVCWLIVAAQADKIKTTPASNAAGTTPLFRIP